MKKRLIITLSIIILVMLTLLFFARNIPNKLKGVTTNAGIEISCDKSDVIIGDKITCELYTNVLSGKIVSFMGEVKLSDNLSLISSNYSSNWSDYSIAENGVYKLSTASKFDGRVSIGFISFKLDKYLNDTNVTLTNLIVGDENYKDISLKDKKVNFKILSTDSNLKALSVTGLTLTPNFNPNITNYNTSTSLSTVTINAVSPENGSVVGIGTKKLNYGNNTFKIISKSESGNTKTYVINIYRNDTRSTNNDIKEVFINNEKVSFTNNSYTKTVENNVDKVNITATLKDNKASVSGTGFKSLNVGKNEFKIIVTAENGSKKTYTIIINRKNKEGISVLSNNAYLKSLTVQDYNINFKKETYKYNLSVDNSVSKLNVSYTKEDEKSNVTITDTNLKVGSNKITIKVVAEDGTTKNYVLNVTRKEVEVFLSDITNNDAKKGLDDNDTVSTLQGQINDSSGNEFILNIYDTDSKTTSSKLLQTIKESSKVLTYKVLDKNNKYIYSLSIDGNNVTNYDEFDFDISFTNNYKDKLNLVIDDEYLPISFSNNKTLEYDVKLNINNNNIIKKGKTYKLYKYNVKTNTLQLVKDNIKSNSDGISFETNDLSNYVLLESSIKVGKKVGKSLIISFALLIVLGIVETFIVKRKVSKDKKIK